jgi:hypothetical protein
LQSDFGTLKLQCIMRSIWLTGASTEFGAVRVFPAGKMALIAGRLCRRVDLSEKIPKRSKKQLYSLIHTVTCGGIYHACLQQKARSRMVGEGRFQL